MRAIIRARLKREAGFTVVRYDSEKIFKKQVGKSHFWVSFWYDGDICGLEPNAFGAGVCRSGGDGGNRND